MSHSVYPLIRPLVLSDRWRGETEERESIRSPRHQSYNNYLSTDFKTIVAALNAAQRFVTAKAWEGFVIGAWEQPTSASADEEFAQCERNHSFAYVKSLDWFLLTFPNIIRWPEPCRRDGSDV